ncbi:MAG: hypothetical protein ACC654_05870 [Acidimicrobiia bacterium]
MARQLPGRNTSIGDLALTTPDRDTVVLRDRITVPTVVILARYYG